MTSIMGVADDLLEKMESWIRQRERCADQLEELARELESIREKCNGMECLGSSMSVVGAASLLGAGIVTLLTGGAAVPLLGLVGVASGGVGATITVGTKITEPFMSSGPMEKAKKIEKRSNAIGREIQELTKRLRDQIRRQNSSFSQDQLDQAFMNHMVQAVDRRNRIDIVAVAGILALFAVELGDTESGMLADKAVQQLIKTISSIGAKTVLKGGAMVVGGAVGMAFALPEAIDSWKRMIENNHVTEASQSLRDTARHIREMTRTLRRQLDRIS